MAKRKPKPRYSIKLADFGLDPKKGKARMQRMADVIRAEWIAEAKTALGGKGRRYSAYVMSVGIREVTENTCVVEIPHRGGRVDAKVARLTLLAEFGIPAHDMLTYLEGKNVRFDRPTAQWAAMAANAKHVRDTVRHKDFKHTFTKVRPDGTRETAWGSRLGAGKAPRLRQHHVTDSLAGMVKRGSVHTKGIRTSGFRIWRHASRFRTLPDGTKEPTHPDAWKHPGLPAHNIALKVAKVLPTVLRDFI